MDYGNQIYIDKVSKQNDQWEPDTEYMKKYDHTLWQQLGTTAEGAGHGGIDYFVLRDFIESEKKQDRSPIDVYDAAAWSAISPLSEASIAQGSAPVQIPDFARGKWKLKKPVFGM